MSHGGPDAAREVGVALMPNTEDLMAEAAPLDRTGLGRRRLAVEHRA